MVGLSEKLYEVLDLRKSDFTGEDIKHVVESILMNEATEAAKEHSQDKAVSEKIMKEWMIGGE